MESFEHALPAGTLIDDRYRIDSVLGEGGFAITYKAFDSKLHSDVAIKEFLPVELAARSSDTRTVQPRTNRNDDYSFGLKKFLEEARTLDRVQHPNIVRVRDFIEANGTAYLIMDYADGQELGDWLDTQPGSLSEDAILNIITPILKGLTEVHDQGLLHRDIKPGNIYLRQKGGPMLIDFGAARQAVGEKSKSMSAIISEGYAPPEQYSTHGKQGNFTDLYAIGATLYHLITGIKPIDASARSHANSEGDPDPLKPAVEAGKGKVSDWLLKLTDQLLNLPSKNRPQSARAVLDAIASKSSVVEEHDTTSTGSPASSSKTRVVNESERFGQGEKGNTVRKPAPSSTNEKPSNMGLIIGGVAALLVAIGVGVYVTQQPDATTEIQRPPQVTQPTVPPPPAPVVEQAPRVEEPVVVATPAPEPEPEPPPVTVGELIIRSNVSGDRVFINGKAVGGSGPQSHELEAGRYDITVTKRGYKDWTDTVELQAGDTKTLRATLAVDRLPFEPEMVSIPGGSFQMGSNDGDDDEKPVHRVTISPFKLAKFEVTKGQYAAFVRDTNYRTDAEKNTGDKDGCFAYQGGTGFGWTVGTSWRNQGFTVGDNEPVVCVSHNDVKAFIDWLNRKTGKQYRLPTEAEWEYAARAGSTTKYHFGNSESQLCQYANVADQSAKQRFSGWMTASCTDGYTFLAPVGSFKPNSFGLYDMHGNVLEWTRDCWNESYSGVTASGKAWMSGDCDRRVVRGGSWSSEPDSLRSAYRNRNTTANRFTNYGFRLAHD